VGHTRKRGATLTYLKDKGWFTIKCGCGWKPGNNQFLKDSQAVHAWHVHAPESLRGSITRNER
jgi:hypothetical protein